MSQFGLHLTQEGPHECLQRQDRSDRGRAKFHEVVCCWQVVNNDTTPKFQKTMDLMRAGGSETCCA